jgi:diguanylate cyclase (GGDEF)-like protein
MKFIGYLILVLAQLPAASALFAEPVDLLDARVEVGGEHTLILKESNGPMSVPAVLSAYKKGRFSYYGHATLSFGIGAQPVWLYFKVRNATDAPLPRRLSIQTAWLDKLSIYFLRREKPITEYQLGDRLPFIDRPLESRYFEIDRSYLPGTTTVLIRVESIDPMVLPIVMHDIRSAHADDLVETYTYGFIYGILFALAAYNLILFFTLKTIRYLLYTIYLLSFILMNAAYTGHAYRWLWPDSPQWQSVAIPLLMVGYAFVGLLFATVFLHTRKSLPRLHKLVFGICVLTGIASILAVLFNSQLYALLIAFVFALVFSITMVVLGVASLCAGNRSAKFFLIASITHTCTAMVTALTVWGVVPYTSLGYHAVEFGMAIDAILLSIALADQLRIINAAKLHAENLAMTDPLTGMNNRRAFYEKAKPLWHTGLRNKQHSSILMIDVDHFKMINDKYGHAEGDRVLEQLGKALSEMARAGDVVARWGGEEFIVFLPSTNIDTAIEVAERIRESIAALQIRVNQKILGITASIGVARNGGKDTSIDVLILEADKCLYKAKQEGRNRVCASAESC